MTRMAKWFIQLKQDFCENDFGERCSQKDCPHSQQKDTIVSDLFFLSMNPNQIRSTSVNGFSSHIGLSHRMFPFRIRRQEEQRPPKSEMLTTSVWRVHWQSGVRVNSVQEVYDLMHNTSKETTNQHEKNIVVFTLDFPNDNWKSITTIVTLSSSFAEERL